MIIHENGPLPFLIRERAQDGELFELWDGTTVYNDGAYDLRSKRDDFLVHTTGPGGFYCWGPFELEDLCEIVWRWKEYRIHAAVAGSATSQESHSTATSSEAETSPQYFHRGIRFPTLGFTPPREMDVVVQDFGGAVEGRIPGSDMTGGQQEFTADNSDASYSSAAGFLYLLSNGANPFSSEYDAAGDYYYNEGTIDYFGNRVAKGPDGKLWVTPDFMAAVADFSVSGSGFIGDANPPYHSQSQGTGIFVLRNLRYLPGTVSSGGSITTTSYLFEEIETEFLLERGTITARMDAVRQDFISTPDNTAEFPGYNCTVTTMKIVFTPEKFFTFGGLYDEDTGARV